MIESGGRIVNVTSASGPNYVARCDAQEQAFFTDADVSWEQLECFIGDITEVDSDYGFSKACANSYTMYLATRFPGLFINACTPGFIETDLGKDFLGDRTPQEAGMKTPADGARVIMSLLFDTPRGSGHYYGSDALRSPLDRYRAPGSAEYRGDERDDIVH
jgi:NAD(P)-dependent dehydrogenase (short-subunit alcohol dehydrogenase family)